MSSPSATGVVVVEHVYLFGAASALRTSCVHAVLDEANRRKLKWQLHKHSLRPVDLTSSSSSSTSETPSRVVAYLFDLTDADSLTDVAQCLLACTTHAGPILLIGGNAEHVLRRAVSEDDVDRIVLRCPRVRYVPWDGTTGGRPLVRLLLRALRPHLLAGASNGHLLSAATATESSPSGPSSWCCGLSGSSV